MTKSQYLKSFRQHIAMLAQYKTHIEVDMLKNLILDNAGHIKELNETLPFIELLIDCSERQASAGDITKLADAASAYWFAYLHSEAIHFAVYGQKTCFDVMTEMCADKGGDIVHYESQELLLSHIMENPDDCVVVIYDYSATDILHQEDKLFAIISYSYLMGEEGINKLFNQDYLGYLDAEFKKLYSTTTTVNLVTGSSHAWHAVPVALSNNTVNLSMFSADLLYAKSVILKSLNSSPVQNYILFLSPYFLYFETAKGRSAFSQLIFHTLRAFCLLNSIDYPYEQKNSENVIQSGASHVKPLSAINDDLQDIIVATLHSPEEMQRIRNKVEVNREQEFINQVKSISGKLNPDNLKSKQMLMDHLESEAFTKAAAARGELHAAQARWQRSMAYNKKNLEDIAFEVQKHQRQLVMVIPPFAPEYMQQIPQSMLRELKAFTLSLCEKYAGRLIDLSTDNEFTYRDFLDGDHLNGAGGRKVMARLENAGLDFATPLTY